jgi:adenylate cyclase
MRGATKRRLRIYARVLLVGTLVGVAYGGLVNFAVGESALTGSLVGAITGATITIVIGSIEIFWLPTRRGLAFQRAPFLVTFGVKWLVYGTVITVVNLGALGGRVLGVFAGEPPEPSSTAPLAVVFSFVVTLGFLFVFEIRNIVGRRTLHNIVLGRYHRPRSEERFFLFVDIAGSTALAERVGPVAVHRFLNRVFRLASDPIDDHGGEIYQYVGDEMVVTWTAAEGRDGARPIACFFAIRAALDDAAPKFEREFGSAPGIRAALHAGPVISGEVGGSKRDIVFHGDVMNTAARLEQATRDLGRRFLVSADALGRLAGTERYALEPLGPQTLRGRAAPVEVYACEEGTDMSTSEKFEVTKTETEWRKVLTPEQFRVLRKHGTERAGSSPLDKEHGQGTFVCAACDLPLFASDTKYDSRTGWPSFWAPIEGATLNSTDRSFFTVRTEVHCRRCGGHLGHVFDDGPKPTGLRYCMNGVALQFRRG